MLSITVTIIIITCLVSLAAFYNEKILNDLIFWPPAISNHRQYYRFITCGFIHADFFHLAFNMYSFYFFGDLVEQQFVALFGDKGKLFYALMYITALVICLLPTYTKNINNYNYRSLGASGAVSAVIFAFIFLNPLQKVGLLFLPPDMMVPGFIFGALYLIISTYLDKKGGGNINHSAHIWGAIYGIAFLSIMGYLFSHYHPMTEFINQVQAYFN